MDGRRTHGKMMLLSHTLTIGKSDLASLVEFRPSGLGGNNVTNRWTDDDAQMRGKIMLLSHNLTMRGSDVAILVKVCPVA